MRTFRLKTLTARRALVLLLVVLIVNTQALLTGAQTADAGGGVTLSGGMGSQAIVTVSAAIVALTQLLKFANVINDRRGPIGVLILSALGVVFWGWTTGDVSRASAFGYFAGWIAVATSAAGIFGFTRAAPGAITGGPPNAAGSSPTA